MARIHKGVLVSAVPVLMIGGACRGDEVLRGLDLLARSGAGMERVLSAAEEAQRVLLDAQTRAIMLEQARKDLWATLAREVSGPVPVVEGSVSVPGPGAGLVCGIALAGLSCRRR